MQHVFGAGDRYRMAVLTCIDLRLTPARWASGRESPVKACSCELTASTFQERRNWGAP